LWELDHTRHRRLPEGSALHRAGQSTSGGPAESPLHHYSLETGAALTRVFLAGAAGQQLRAVVEEASWLGSSLELSLHINDDTLARLPWETLRLPETDGTPGLPLALHPQVHLSRVVAGLGPTPAVSIPGPLRILVVVGSPEEQNARGELLDMERELARILNAVEPARKSGKAFVRVLETGSVKAIHEALSTQRYHIVHISCHAAPGVLILEDDEGGEERVTAERLWHEALVPDRGVPLVVLAGCATALSGSQQSDAKDMTANLPSLARELLAHGVPAVVAMQAAVSDPYATALCAELYHALATHQHTTPLTAFSYARHSVETERKEETEVNKHADLAEWATPALYLRGPSLPLYDPTTPMEEIVPLPEPRLAPGVIVRRVGDFVGRRREQRVIRRALRDPDRAGVLLHAMGGVGKSSLAAQVLQQMATEGRLLVSLFGEVAPDTVLAAVGRQLFHHCLTHGLDEKHLWRRIAVDVQQPNLGWQERFEFLAPHIFTALDVIVLLDNFEDNLNDQNELRNDDLAALLALWATNPGRSQLLFTCRYPFHLPDNAHVRLETVHLGPLSLAETRKLVWRLPGLDALAVEELRRAYEEVGGHPRTLEYLDALLRGGQARFKDIEHRLKKALTQKGIGDPSQWYRGTRGNLDVALAEAVTLAADDVLLDTLLARLANVPLATELLLGVSVYRVPVDEIGVVWQVSEERETPSDSQRERRLAAISQRAQDLQARGKEATVENFGLSPQELEQWLSDDREQQRPPLVVPDGIAQAWKALEELGLLAPVQRSEEEARLYTVHRWTAGALAKKTEYTDILRRTHQRAARYWRWRVCSIDQSRQQAVEDMLEARYHYHQAGQIDEAVEFTKGIISQLDTWGAWQRVQQLCRETLRWVQERPAVAKAFLNQLGNVAQHHGAYEEALTWYRKTLALTEEIGDREGLAISYYSIGTIAQRRGAYDEALIWHRKSLTIWEELDNHAGMANSYHQLGMLAQQKGACDEAFAWYHKSLVITEKLGLPREIAHTYHELGTLTQRQGAYDEALTWYHKALAIKGKLGDRAGIANSYHNLGTVAQLQGMHDEALSWYRQAFSVWEELGDHAGMAASYVQIAMLLTDRGAVDEALFLNLQSLMIHAEIQSPNVSINLHWLKRQRELLGEVRFEEIVRERLGEDGLAALLKALEEGNEE